MRAQDTAWLVVRAQQMLTKSGAFSPIAGCPIVDTGCQTEVYRG